MTRKYICDNCGKEFQHETAVCNIEFHMDARELKRLIDAVIRAEIQLEAL
ncbi:MAG: hypothetical protein NWF09_06630 [Candidatus Bathyarchaeota archaeon]|nr:hypothetical protein [Candidatus Bathyarchaeota archaeon]